MVACGRCGRRRYGVWWHRAAGAILCHSALDNTALEADVSQPVFSTVILKEFVAVLGLLVAGTMAQMR